MSYIKKNRVAARLITAFSGILVVSAAAAGEATREYYESIKPGRQMAERCFNEFGQLVLTPSNIGLCAELPGGAVLGFDITPRPDLARECYDRRGNLVITPRNVDLCASLPTAAIIAQSSGATFGDGDGAQSPDDATPAGGAVDTDGTGDTGSEPGGDTGSEPGGDPGTEPGGDPGTEPGGDPGTEPDGDTGGKNNKGHGNGDEDGPNGRDGSDPDNPGKSKK